MILNWLLLLLSIRDGFKSVVTKTDSDPENFNNKNLFKLYIYDNMFLYFCKYIIKSNVDKFSPLIFFSVLPFQADPYSNGGDPTGFKKSVWSEALVGEKDLDFAIWYEKGSNNNIVHTKEILR